MLNTERSIVYTHLFMCTKKNEFKNLFWIIFNILNNNKQTEACRFANFLNINLYSNVIIT